MSSGRGPTLAQQQAAYNRLVREQQRAAKEAEKQARLGYLYSRSEQADAMTQEVQDRERELLEILSSGLKQDTFVSWDALKEPFVAPEFQPGDLANPIPAPVLEAFLPKRPGLLSSLLPGAKVNHERAVVVAQGKFAQAMNEWQAAEAVRVATLEQAQTDFDRSIDQKRVEIEQQHADIDTLAQRFEARDSQAVAEYFQLALLKTVFPDGVPTDCRVAYVPESRQLVVERELPGLDAVPHDKAFRYVKAKDTIEASPQTISKIQSTYAYTVAQTVLRTLHDVFKADRSGCVEVLAVNAHLSTIDPATGQKIHPCLATVRVSREHFLEVDLSQVDPLACLRGLNASVSKNPAELAAVRPVLEFNMVDPRFIQEGNILSTLDQRPNLMELTPSEFETLITNLFQAMGLDTRQTRPSRDGGVDCVAFDPRPILGGKVVIQAKRYKNTVGVSAVRDLYGTLLNEGASKGILVTTSGYGKAAFEFAEGKPLELFSGSNLLALLADHSGIEARIVMPEDWIDPSPMLTEDPASPAPNPGSAGA